MKRHMSNKILSLVLALVMLVGMLPLGAVQPAQAAEVKSDGYTYGVSDVTLNEKIEKILTSVYMGEYPTGHMQGFAIDDEMKYIYASFTTKLAKVDIETGEVVGVVHNWSGHLGDMAYYDGRVYGSLEYKGANSFYIAVFDCDKIVGDVDHTECMRTMYLPEVSKDYGATIDGVKYAYGCSGIDGVAFGTIPGDTSGEIVMMVAYGIFTDASSNVQDRDYQVLLQYDLSDFLESDGQGGTKLRDDRNDILNQSNHHKKGPEHEEKYFIYTGNTNYGIQNLEYDRVSGNYCMAVYVGSCPEFPNYKIFYMDGSDTPVVEDLIMSPERFEAYKALPNANKGCTHMAQGKVVKLADNNGSSTGEATLEYQDCNPGFGDKSYRVWGSDSIPRSPSTGLEHIGGDYFYISQSGGGLTGGQVGYAHLYKYNRDTDTFTAIVREVPPAPAKKLLSYSMDASDLYTEGGVTYMTNGVSDGYDAIVEGTKASVGVDGTADKSLAFNAWNYPAAPDQVYLDEDTIDYLNSEIGKAGYAYSYSFWAKVKTSNDGQFVPFVGMYREDGTYLSTFELRGSANTLKYVVNGVGTAGPGSANAGTDWAKNVGNPTTLNPGDGGIYINSPVSGEWKFYTVTENNGAVTIYENGVKAFACSTTKNHLAAEPAADFIIGGGSAKLWLDMNNRGRLIGSVDNVTIWSGVLTADQVAAEYAKVTTKETSGVATVTTPDKAEAPSANILYASYDLTADKGEDLVLDLGVNVESLEIPGLVKGTDYTVAGTKLTVKASWLAKQECGIIAKTVGGITVKLTITNEKVPVLSYSFDKSSLTGTTVKDSSEYGVDAIANNIGTFGKGRTGVANGSFFFNGHDYKNPTYVKLSTDDAAWLNSILRDGYTLNFWAQAQAENGNLMTFAGLYGADARPLGVVETNDTTASGGITNTAIDGVLNVQASAAKKGTQTAQNAKALSAAEVGEWAMYSAVYDKASNTLKLYVNGALCATATAADDILGEISQLVIGHTYKKYFSGTANTRGGFYGNIDNFEVYNYALSAEDINVLAGGGAIQPAIKSKPVVHWTMDAASLNTNGTMKDSSENDFTSYFQNVTPVAGVDGKEGGALYFDGSADADEFSRVWLSQDGIADLNDEIGDAITVAFWMKPDFASQGENYPYTGTWTPVGGVFGESDHRFLMVAEFRYGQMTYCAQPGSDKHIAALGASGWKDDQWYYVVMTYDAATTETLSGKDNTYHRMFIMGPDGTVNEYTGSRPFTSTTLYNKITQLEFGGQYAKGHWQDTNVRGRYIGAIDDIKVYNVPVSKDDVAKLAANRPATVAGSYTAPQAPAPAETYFEPAVLTFDKTAPADVTFTAKENFGSVASVEGEYLVEEEYAISGTSVTIKSEYLMQQQPGAVEFTVTSAAGAEQTVTVYVTNTAPAKTNPAGEEPFPVLYYPMDKGGITTVTNANGNVTGTIADASGNGIHLVSTGITATAADKDGTADAATWFDSYREYNISYAALGVEEMDVLNTLLDDEITFSFWHKSDRISSNYMPVLGLYAEDDRPLLLAEFYAGTGGERRGAGQATTPAFTATPKNSVTVGEGSLRASSTVTMNSTWHHYVMTYNNTTGAAVLYVDGVKAGEATLTAGQLDDVATFEIGALANADYYNVGASTGRDTGMSLASHGRLHGHLDEVKVYNVALTAENVTALYELGVGEELPEDYTGVKTLVSIEITAPAKTEYAVGEELDVTGGTVTLNFIDGTSKTIDMTADMVSGFDSSLGVEDLELTVSYSHKGVTKTATYTVDVIKVMTGIQVTTNPDKMVYGVGEELDVTGGKVTVTYDDGTTKVIDLTEDMVSGFDSSLGGACLLTVTYTEAGVTKTTALGVTIEKALASIELTTVPETTEYGVGDELDVTGGKVTLTYDDGTTEVIDLTADMVSGFDSSLGVEDLEVTVTYGECTDTYTVDVIKELESIEVNGLDTSYRTDEELDVEGATVTLIYDDGTTEEIELTEDMVEGFDTSEAGKYTITVTVDGVSTEVEITVRSILRPSDEEIAGGLVPAPEEPDEPEVPVETCPSAHLTDIPAVIWYHEYVDYVVANGLMTGVTATTFDPNGTMTRAMVWTVLARLSGENVDGGTPWYAKAQEWAMAEGVSDGTMANDAITREQLVTMLYRYIGEPEVTVADKALLDDYTDGAKVSDWAVDAMAWAISNGIINGVTEDTLDPQGVATRAQVAAILQRFCILEEEKA